jgi:putative sporulation protein YyaC
MQEKKMGRSEGGRIMITTSLTTTKYKGLKSIPEIQMAMKNLFPSHLTLDDLYFVCIGTDRSTGDSLGPLVGRLLSQRGYVNYAGDLENPVHAVNLDEVRAKLPKDKIIIGIDACLGEASSIGSVSIGMGPLRPGAGVNKDLGTIGDYHINAIVNVGGFMEFFVLQNTRLALVMRLAELITDAICETFPRSFA